MSSVELRSGQTRRLQQNGMGGLVNSKGPGGVLLNCVHLL